MSNKNRCTILGALPVPLYFKNKILHDYIICADGGIDNAKLLGVKVQMALGDWDSVKSEFYTEDIEKIVTLPKEKDDTDMYFAARCAIELGFEEVQILGGIGGRLDHTFANVQTLLFLEENGVYAYMESENFFCTVIQNNTRTFTNKDYTYISILSLDEKSDGVNLRGVKYPLTNAVLYGNFPLGISNEFLDDIATVSVENGTLVVMLVK